MNTELLMRQLEIDEGNVLRVHMDRLGRKTVGIGHRDEALTLGDKINKNKVQEYFLADLTDSVETSVKIFFEVWACMPTPAQETIINIVFNLKETITLELPDFIYAMYKLDYKKAAIALRGNKWGDQYPERVNRLARKLEDLI